jgi:hypothetical protein
MPFIVGAPRSGTTLLRLMLDSHPDLAIPPETGFLTGPTLLPGGGPHEFLRSLKRSQNWADLHLDDEKLLANLSALTAFNPADAYRVCYATYASRFSKPRYGDKTPSYAFHMERIEQLLPEAHFIHIIRDGRDTAISLRRQWFSPGQEMTTQARFWADHVRTARASAGKVRRYLEIRFETLILDTEATLSKICTFIGLDFSADMLRYYERAPARLHEHEGRNLGKGRILTKSARIDQQARTMLPPQRDLVFGWRHEMKRQEIVEFQTVAGTLLRDLGYELV